MIPGSPVHIRSGGLAELVLTKAKGYSQPIKNMVMERWGRNVVLPLLEGGVGSCHCA